MIGVFSKRKQVFGGGRNQEDNMATFPIGTFMTLHPEDAVKSGVWVSVKYDDQKNRSLVEDEATRTAPPPPQSACEQPDNFEVFSPDSLARLWKQLTGGLAIFMVAVSSVGLMVGGVGVMNIMLVSVTERTKEIGVRKAIGATKRNILLQFTIEAITLCALGGVIGIVAGGILTLLIRCWWVLASVHVKHMGDHRLYCFMHDRPGIRHLPGVEGREPRSHRSTALRIERGAQGIVSRFLCAASTQLAFI